MSGITRSGANKYPNPFFDIASEYVPSDINSIFELCEFLMTTMAPFHAVASRVVRYFLTEIVVEGEDDEEREKYENFLVDQLKLVDVLGEVGEDFTTYGNVFLSLYLPFDRMLKCPECETSYHCETIDYSFKDGQFTGICPKCNKMVTFSHKDMRSPDVERARLVRWNPQRMKLRVHPVSGRTEYYHELDPEFCQKIKEGNKFFLNDTPWAMIQTALRPKDNLFLFKPGSIFHLRTGSLSGLPIRGWGIPPMLPNFKLRRGDNARLHCAVPCPLPTVHAIDWTGRALHDEHGDLRLSDAEHGRATPAAAYGRADRSVRDRLPDAWWRGQAALAEG